MDVARSEHPAVVLDGELVVVGGFVVPAPGRTAVTESVEAYDPASDTWRTLAELPDPRHHAMATVVDGRLFVLGGFSSAGFEPTDTVWELTDVGWEQRTPIPSPVAAGAAVSVDGSIYVVGGVPAGGLLRYELEGDRWVTLASPEVTREHLAAVVLDGEIWAIAGRWRGEIFSSTEIYDPESDTWRPGPSLMQPRSGFGATTFGDTIAVAGGEIFGPDESLDSLELLDDGSWSLGEALPFGIHGNPLVFVPDRLYLPGGSTRAGGVDNPGTIFSLPVGEP